MIDVVYYSFKSHNSLLTVYYFFLLISQVGLVQAPYYLWYRVCKCGLFSLQCSCEGPAHQDHREERANSRCVQEEVIMYMELYRLFISAIYDVRIIYGTEFM